MARIAVLPELDAAAYTRHRLHAEERIWVEKNCYIDIWIEMAHALGCEPMAMLGFVAALDFEGDQWTFFKPPHEELRDLFGLDVQELNVWRPLLDHAETHLGAGKLISTEADAFFLPDTAGTDYKHQHTKTTIVINSIDREQQTLGYFHNAGYYALSGDDFVQTFRVGFAPDPTFMPLFAELVRIDRKVARSPEELRAIAWRQLARHVARRPGANPIARFGAQFNADLAWVQTHGLAFYHAWAFGTIRQLGAATELLSLHLEWLGDERVRAAASEFLAISTSAKAFILKAARAVNAKRALDASALFDEMSAAWQRGMVALDAALIA